MSTLFGNANLFVISAVCLLAACGEESENDLALDDQAAGGEEIKDKSSISRKTKFSAVCIGGSFKDRGTTFDCKFDANEDSEMNVPAGVYVTCPSPYNWTYYSNLKKWVCEEKYSVRMTADGFVKCKGNWTWTGINGKTCNRIDLGNCKITPTLYTCAPDKLIASNSMLMVRGSGVVCAQSGVICFDTARCVDDTRPCTEDQDQSRRR